MTRIELGNYMIKEDKDLGIFYIYKIKIERRPKWKIWKKKRKRYYLASSKGFRNLAQAIYFVKNEI
jgi:hypothetical protein